MNFDEELKELQEWCKVETEKCYNTPTADGLDDRPSIAARQVYQEYNEKLKQLKQKYDL